MTLARKQITGGPNKLSLTERQNKHFAKAKQSNKGIHVNLSAGAIKDIAKTGGIFPLLAAIPGITAAAAPAVANADVLGVVGTAAGMALKKATGKGIKKKKKKGKGLRLQKTRYGNGLRTPGTRRFSLCPSLIYSMLLRD